MRGLKYLFIFLKNVTKYIGGYSAYLLFLPKWFFVLYMLFKVFIEISKEGFINATRNAIYTIFSAEYTLVQKIPLAIANTGKYSFLDLLAVINAVIIIFLFFKYTTFIIRYAEGANPNLGGFIITGLLFIIFEVVIMMVSGEWFVPIKDGILELVFNIEPILFNWM